MRGRFVLLVFLCLAFLGAGLTAGAGPAFAHSELLESQPEYGVTVPQGPEQIFLRFTKKLDLSYSQLDLRSRKGAVKLRKPIFGAGRRSLKIPIPALPPASYTLSYWLVAEDSHVMGGEVLFSVADPDPQATAAAAAVQAQGGGSALSALPSATKDLAAAPAGTPDGPTPEQRPLALTDIPRELGGSIEEQAAGSQDRTARVKHVTTVKPAPLAGFEEVLAGLDYAFLALLVGGGVFLVMAWPAGGDVRKARRLLWYGLIGAFVTTVAAIGVKVASLTQLAVEGSLRPSVAAGVFGTWFGRSAMTRAGLLVLAVPLLIVLERQGEKALRSAQWRNWGVLLGLAALMTHLAVGHAATSMYGRTVGLVHLVAISIWIGGLVILGVVVLPRRQGPELIAVVPQFSKLAMRSVLAMAGTGSLLLFVVAPNWGKLLGSEYGQALVIKLIVVALLLGAAHLSRRFTQRKLMVSAGRRTTVALTPFVASVGLEIVLAAGVLAMTAILTSQPPPA